ncbi:MAG: sugar ABC transporter substrate-binding protein [Oscillibacter sp.]|nr:sugar ABC transporter substrate-binding protein [Oscillibacter sp.]
MKRISKRAVLGIGTLTAVFPLLMTACLLFFWPRDVSENQTEHRTVFGATYMTMNNPYYQVMDIQLRAEIEKNGDILLTRDAAMNQTRQNEEIRELIAAGARAIFLTPVEWDTSEEGLRIAAEAGVPVIVVDAPVRDAELAACSILSDNYRAGVLCAEHLRSVRKSAKILLLEHITAHSGSDRIRGFLDAIQNDANYVVLGSGESDGQIENAMPVMESRLERYPDADTVMALNDPSAFGAMAAIEGAGLSERFLVYGVDGSPEAKALVRDGLMTATCAQFPYQIAKEAVRQAYLVLEGRREQREVIVPVELLTAENVEEYGITGRQ